MPQEQAKYGTHLLALSYIFSQTWNLHHHSDHSQWYSDSTWENCHHSVSSQSVEPLTTSLSFSDDHEKKFREITELSNLAWQIVQILGLQISD